jgi:hypothetical protein
MFSTAEEWFKEGKLEKVAEITQMIEQVAGDFASVKYFIGGVWYSADSYKSAGYLMEADAGGLRNLLLWESLAQQEEARWQLEEALMYREKIARSAPRPTCAFSCGWRPRGASWGKSGRRRST